MAVDPAAELGALLATRLHGRPAAPAAEVPAPPTPRVPAPNRFQGTSGIAAPPQPSGPEVFEQMLMSLKSRPRGMWSEATADGLRPL